MLATSTLVKWGIGIALFLVLVGAIMMVNDNIDIIGGMADDAEDPSFLDTLFTSSSDQASFSSHKSLPARLDHG